MSGPVRNGGRDQEEESAEEESEGLLHLCSDWPGSPSAAPYKCQARPITGCLRHPGEECARAGGGPRIIRWSGR